MTHPFKRFGKLAIPAVALSLSVFGLAATSNAHSKGDNPSDLPLNCEIEVSKGRYGYTYEGIVHASSTTKGTYELNIKQSGASGRAVISQSGDFYVPAGTSKTLGQATFGGLPPASVDAELTLRFNGHTLACSNQSDI